MWFLSSAGTVQVAAEQKEGVTAQGGQVGGQGAAVLREVARSGGTCSVVNTDDQAEHSYVIGTAEQLHAGLQAGVARPCRAHVVDLGAEL